MRKQAIEFIIHRDGTVEERPTGFAGPECEEVTRQIELRLGEVAAREPTAERYETPARQESERLEDRDR